MVSFCVMLFLVIIMQLESLRMGLSGGGINWLDLVKPLIQINISWFAVIILVAALVLLDQQA